MNRRTSSFGTLLVVVSAVILLSAVSAAAQEAGQWLPFEQIPGYHSDTITPYLVADQNRTVHAFSDQLFGESADQKAIYYNQWTAAGGWTSPVDIILAPSGEPMVLGAFLDQEGTLHLIFRGGSAQDSKVYYSKGPVNDPDKAPSWSAPEAVGDYSFFDVSSAAITGDDQGNVTIIYNGKESWNGVYEIHSSDAGDNWSEPTPIFLTYDASLVPFSLQLIEGQEGQLHAAWNVVDPTGVDEALYYARKDLASQVWTNPTLVDERIDREGFFGPSYPSIADNGEQVVIMFNGGKLSSGGIVDAGRPVQRVAVSYDNGTTWNPISEPFPQLQGRSGSHALAVDSSGAIHAVFLQRIERTVEGQNEVTGGMWHSEFQANQWIDTERVRIPLAGHDLRAVVSQGNTLLVAMREDPGRGRSGVWYSHVALDAPELELHTVPTMTVPPTAVPSPTPTPAQTASPTPTKPVELAGDQFSTPAANANNISYLLLVGIAPAFLLLLGFVIFHRVSRSYRG